MDDPVRHDINRFRRREVKTAGDGFGAQPALLHFGRGPGTIRAD
jgi:hypothetical protein